MAEFNYYAAWVDSLSYISKIASLNRYTFAIRMAYKHNKPPLFTSLDAEKLELIKMGYPILILSKQSEPSWSFIQSEKNPSFMINTQQSGPLLELRLPHETEKEGKLYITSGWLDYPSKLIDPQTLEATSMPEYIKQEYLLLQKQLKKELKKYYILAHKEDRNGNLVPSRVPLWIGLNALDLLKQGRAVIRFGKDVITMNDMHGSIRVKTQPS